MPNVYRAITNLAQVLLDSRPPIAYVGGWTGKNNLGDEVLLDAARHIFSERALFQYPGGRLARTSLNLIPQLRHGLLGGGTLIGQKQLWLDITQEYQKQRHSLVVFGTGVEDATFWPGDPPLEAWRPILKKCSFLGVRGPISARLLETIGCQDVHIVGDPVLVYAHDTPRPDISPDCLGLNIGTADGRLFGGSELRVASEMAKIATTAKRNGWSVEWFVVWPKDLELTRRVANETGTAERIHEVYTDRDRFMQLVGRLGAFVGMKLHATLLATCALVPSIMIEYRPKCRDFMASIDQEHATIRSDEFRADHAWSMLSSWHSRRPERVASLHRGIHALLNVQAKTAQHLLKHCI